jgi:paraquat-inducible protein A
LRKPLHCGKGSAQCPRCGATLYRSSSVQLERISALTLGALFTFLIAQAFPIVELEMNGATSQTTLIGALVALWSEGMQLVAIAVFCSTILFPLVELLALLYVLVPIRAGAVPPGFNLVLRAVQFVRPWGMVEVLMLGILVTIVKMTSLARVIPEAALFAFGALTLMLAVVVLFDPRALWDIADAIKARGAHGDPFRQPSPPAADGSARAQ